MIVNIVELKPMQSLSFSAYAQEPENAAWGKMIQWCEANGIELKPGTPIYGFNYPNPSAGSDKYGYEFLVALQQNLGGKQVKDFPGGLYAVMDITVEDGSQIPGEWDKLHKWREESSYKPANHQWLEEHDTQGNPIRLLMPIKE